MLSRAPLARSKSPSRASQAPAAARTFALWRLQAVLDAYAEMDSEAKVRADALLTSVGGSALATFQLPARMARKDCRLVLA